MTKLMPPLQKTLSFVLLRKKEGSGYGATPLLPATLEDTFYALKILNYLRKIEILGNYKPEADKGLKTFLKGFFLESLEGEPRKLYQLLECYRLTRLKRDFTRVSEYLKNFEGTLTLERAYYLGRLSEISHERIVIMKTFPFKTVKDLFMGFYLSEKGFLKGKLKRKDVKDFLIRCENPDGGYGFYPGTTSYVDNIYYALMAFDLLKERPPNPERTYEYLLFCQNPDGGFARRSGAVSFLDSTFYAVSSFKILSKWLSRKPFRKRRDWVYKWNFPFQ